MKIDKAKSPNAWNLLERFVRTNLEELKECKDKPVFIFEVTPFDKNVDGNISSKHAGKTSSELLQEAAYVNFEKLIDE